MVKDSTSSPGAKLAVMDTMPELSVRLSESATVSVVLIAVVAFSV